MKQDYTLDELQTEMTALAQLFDSVTLADPVSYTHLTLPTN